ncbi:C2 domain-containing protein 5-like [Temnothorax curvispinosus]|uniref:C2 domain-containing protein 5-like n=1 Tax=Temnothorax curvispinosus TaxID=300111 RepID=A0A6J1Q495_9HYME|nr:C2 domain-containing protein 5-like [Temnothorax curvispinosus]
MSFSFAKVYIDTGEWWIEWFHQQFRNGSFGNCSRAHITALGGNATVAFFMTQCVLLHSPHKKFKINVSLM